MAGVRRRRLTPGEKIVVAVAVLVSAAVPAWMFGGSYLRERDAALSRASEARIEGPPCPSLTRAQFEAQGLKAPKATLYEDVVFARQFGHMDCRLLRYGAAWKTEVYPVCQFTSPKALKVTTPKGEWYFSTGPGQPATVGTPHGEARCVLGGNFTINDLVAP